jgi:hypothetical protein
MPVGKLNVDCGKKIEEHAATAGLKPSTFSGIAREIEMTNVWLPQD